MLPLLQPIQWIVVHIRVSENCSSCTSFARDQMNSTTYSEKNVENVSYQSSMRAVTVFIFFTSICSVVGMWQEQILLNAPLKWPFCHDGILLRSRHISKAFFFFQMSFFIRTLESNDPNSPNTFIFLFFYLFPQMYTTIIWIASFYFCSAFQCKHRIDYYLTNKLSPLGVSEDHVIHTF